MFDQLIPHWVEHVLITFVGIWAVANILIAVLPAPAKLKPYVSQTWLKRYTVVLIFIQAASWFRKRWNPTGGK